jgi:hypothetical protein
VSTARSAWNGAPSRALGLGLLAVVTYALLAAWSGAITPLARGPVLDGLGPVNYRWVAPPPELESTNQEPSAGRFDLELTARGVGTQVVFTSDSQVTIVIDAGAIGPAADAASVELRVDPVDPAGLGVPGDGLEPFGNAYELSASYRPGRTPVGGLDRPLQVILLYPATSTLHANTHDVLHSTDGETWQVLETTDTPGQQQAEAQVPDLGYVMVAGVPSPVTASPAPSEGGGTPPVAIALLVAAGVAFVIGLGLLIRSRSR